MKTPFENLWTLVTCNQVESYIGVLKTKMIVLCYCQSSHGSSSVLNLNKIRFENRFVPSDDELKFTIIVSSAGLLPSAGLS